MRISEAYREQNRQLHDNPNYGISGAKWAGLVNDIYNSHSCNSVLDYGCGKETLGKALPHLMVKGYDPCIPGLATAPASADLVVCGDVMEHVEEGCVDEVLDHLQVLANKAVLLVISTQKAAKTLPDGRNAHITIRPGDWWLEKIMQRWTVTLYQAKGNKEIVCLAKPKAAQ